MSRAIGPILKYPGSKWRMARHILRDLPPHTTYLEPFAGSLAVFFSKPPSRLETINDRDSRVVNLFRVVRERPDELARAVALTLWSREEYETTRALLPSGDQVEDARRFLVRCWQSHGSRLDRFNGWRHSTQGNPRPRVYTTDWGGLPDRLIAVAERLQAAQIECRPALDVLARYANPDCLVYADPPYVGSSRADSYYRHEMTDDDHLALLDALDAHPGPVLLSGYACALYDDRLAHWQRETVAATAEGGRARTEVVWRNARAARPMLDLTAAPPDAAHPRP